jgi:hypothetical protein
VLEGVDETKALYEWNYKKQLLSIQAGGGSWDELSDDYASCIDDMAELRTLRQLERFIALRL